MSKSFNFFAISRRKQVAFLFVVLVVSILSALFMPAMFTFYITFPILLLFIAIQDKYLFGVLLFLFVISFGLVYIAIFMLFIYFFPTYIILLTTVLIIYFLPKKIAIWSKIVLFFIISIILGLNTQLLNIISDIFTQRPIIEEKINNTLQLKATDIIKITGNTTELYTKYNKYDYITYSANEGWGGFWEYPKIEKMSINDYFKKLYLPYTQKNDSPYIINLESSKNNSLYNTIIQIKSNGKILSSLKISDRLPFLSKIDNRNLDNLDLRLEYLLRQNIWNAILLSTQRYSKDNYVETIISDFLKKSISYKPIYANWYKNTYFLKSNLIKTSDTEDCTTNFLDNYKYYEFNIWKEAKSNTSAKIANNIFSFDSNNTTYSTKILSKYSPNIQAYNEILWNDYNFSYAANNNIYAFFVFRLNKYIRIIQFTKTGKFVKELYIELPKDLILDGRDWHPISHVKIIGDKIQLRLYNIYELKDAKNQCKYNILETEL